MMSTGVSAPSRSWPVWWPAIGLIALLGAATLVTRADADLWGHVRFGLDILETWRLPTDDPYSFTQDRPWINHEWLAELLMGTAWAVGGAAGLVVLKGGLVSATILVIWTAWRHARIGVQLTALLVLVAGTLQMTSPLRPQLWTFLCLAILVRVLADDDRRGRRWLPLLFVLWANAHGGWVVGLGVLLAWTVGEALRDRASRGQGMWVLAACLGGTLVTPYGMKLWVFVASTVRPERPIEEWMPLWAADPWNWLGWTLAVILSIWQLARPSAQRVPRAVVLGMLGYGGLTVLRIGPLFLEAALILFGSVAAIRWPARSARIVVASPAAAVAGLLLILAPGVVAMRLSSFATQCIPPLRGADLDVAAVETLARTTGPARLVTHFNWGEYAIWHLGPRIRVSVDGRRETVYSDARLAEHDAIVDGAEAGLTTLRIWNPEYVWLPASSSTTRDWLVGRGYRVEFETAASFIAVRGDLPELPASSSARSTRCFPR